MMELKFFEKFRMYTLHKKLNTVIYIIILIPILALFLYIGFNARSTVINNYKLNANQRITALSSIINQKMYLMFDRSSYIKQHNEIIEIFSGEFDWEDLSGATQIYRQLDSYLAGYALPFSAEKTDVTIYPINNEMPQGKYVSNLSELKKSEKWEEVLNSDNNDLNYMWETRTDNGTTILLYRTLRSFNNDIIGYIEIKADYRDFLAIYKDTELYKDEIITHITADGNCLYGCKESADTTRYYITEKALINGDVLQIKIPKKSVYEVDSIQSILIIVLFLVIVVSIKFINKSIIKSLLRELDDFTDLIKSNKSFIENDDLIKVDGNDEISIIKQSFKDIIRHTRMIDAAFEKSNKIQQQLKFEVLQTGINPHLLYNTLSVLRWKMVRKQQKELVEIIDIMTRYYRNVLSDGKYIISIEKEIELTKSFIKINELCYAPDCEVNINIDEEIKNCYTIKLILQPFVENAFLHGVNGLENGRVAIFSKTDDDVIYLYVEDNGYGIDNDIVKQINSGTYFNEHSNSGYAITNTNKRIKAYYGEDYGVKIENGLNSGTRIEIKIPRITE